MKMTMKKLSDGWFWFRVWAIVRLTIWKINRLERKWAPKPITVESERRLIE